MKVRILDDEYDVMSIKLNSDVSYDITLDLCYKRSDTKLWAIRDKLAHTVLNIHGKWEFEPSPSNRDDDFLTRCRFTSPESAVMCYNKSIKGEIG